MELTVTNRSQAYPKGTMVSEFGKRIEKGNVRVMILCAVLKVRTTQHDRRMGLKRISEFRVENPVEFRFRL